MMAMCASLKVPGCNYKQSAGFSLLMAFDAYQVCGRASA